MLGTSISSFLFIIMSSLFGMPISGTHTVVGGLIGAGLATVGAAGINWKKLGVIVASWVVAPVVAILCCILFFTAICRFTMNSARNSFQARLLWLTLFTAVAFALICFMIIKLIQTGGEKISNLAWGFLALSPFLGVFLTRLILLVLAKPEEVGACEGLGAVFKFWSGKDFEVMLLRKHSKTNDSLSLVAGK